MVLYHAGFDVIKEPDIHYGRKNADFGQGFYTTPDKEFAYRWAKESSEKKTIVNQYELDTDGLVVKNFTRSEEWFEYIYANRHRKPDELAADVIVGHIANDIIYETLGITTSGYLGKHESMELLMIRPEYIQVVIKTEKANSKLRWISSDELTCEQLAEYQKVMAKENEEFQQALEKMMENPDLVTLLRPLMAYDMGAGHKTRWIESTNDYTTQVLYRLGFQWPPTAADYVHRFIDTIIGFDYFKV